jgi:hypothetical protein
MKLSILFFSSLVFCIPSLSQNITVMSTYSCGKYVESRAQSSIAPSVWLLGFLSGANTYKSQTHDVLKDVDRQSIFLWMDKYCKEKPLDYIDDGARLLLTELHKKTSEANKR